MSLSVTCPRDLVLNAPGEAHRGHAGDHARQAEFLHRPRLVLVAGQRDPRGRRRRAAGPHRTAAPAAATPRGCSTRDSSGRSRSCPNTIGLITGRGSQPPSTTSCRWPPAAGPRCGSRCATPSCRAPTPCRRSSRRCADSTPTPTSTSSCIARGGGSVEDLLPFSDETLCREIATCTTPVVSAIGHEPDNPLCDLVADLRAATPTDAAKRIVPDAAAEQALRRRSAPAQRAGAAQLGAPRAAHRSTSCAAGRCWPQPLAALTARADEIHRARTAARRDVTRLVAAETDRIGHLSARLTTLGPAATLARGYAVVQTVPRRLRCCARRPTHRRGRGCACGCRRGDHGGQRRAVKGRQNEAH